MVTEGKVVTDSGIRVLRNGKEVHVGVVDSLRRVKEIVKEVHTYIYIYISSCFYFFCALLNLFFHKE